MAYISFQPTDFFTPKIYTGTGASNALTGLGFQPDFIWIKDRDGGNGQMWTDAVRGAGVHLESDGQQADITQAEGVTSFDDYKSKIDDNTACVVVQSPNYYGLLD